MSSIRAAGRIAREAEWQAEPCTGRAVSFCSARGPTAHPRVKREAIGLHHPFQSATRAVQGPNGANHERFLSLLWADSNPIGWSCP